MPASLTGVHVGITSKVSSRGERSVVRLKKGNYMWYNYGNTLIIIFPLLSSSM